MVALSFYVSVGFDEVIIYVMCIMYVETFYVTSIFAYSKERIYNVPGMEEKRRENERRMGE